MGIVVTDMPVTLYTWIGGILEGGLVLHWAGLDRPGYDYYGGYVFTNLLQHTKMSQAIARNV